MDCIDQWNVFLLFSPWRGTDDIDTLIYFPSYVDISFYEIYVEDNDSFPKAQAPLATQPS